MSELTMGALVLGRYRIVRPLGRGGMGVVYLGRTEGAAGFTRPVVIKRLHAELAGDQDKNEMFAREARILAHLQHPNIVSVIDFGQEGASYVMVLEYVHGYDLDQWLRLLSKRQHRLSYEYVLYIARRVLLALAHAHELRRPDGTPANIVHRDVSLSNVLLDTGAQVKLHDFGIARMEGGGERPTDAGVFKGKLSLAAPELLRGGTATPQSDVYSTALITYQLLTGQNPFKGKTEAETMFRILEHVPPAPSSLRGDLPMGLDEALGCALHKDPKARFGSAALFAEALGAFCPRSDEQVIRDLARQLGEDFAILPEYLRIESLTERDAAWREAQNVPPDSQVPLNSSAPPDPARPSRAAPGAQHEIAGSSAPLRRRSVPPHPRALAVIIGAGVVALTVLSLTVRSKTVAEPPARYLVLENPNNPPAHRAASATDPASSSPPAVEATAAVAPSPALVASTPKAAKPVPPNAVALSQQFKTQQPQVESCFRRHAEEIEGKPRVSLRFEVDRAGTVTQATISPPALASTPLGRCLLQVATGSRFGRLTEPAAFSIPITAKRGTENK